MFGVRCVCMHAQRGLTGDKCACACLLRARVPARRDQHRSAESDTSANVRKPGDAQQQTPTWKLLIGVSYMCAMGVCGIVLTAIGSTIDEVCARVHLCAMCSRMNVCVHATAGACAYSWRRTAARQPSKCRPFSSHVDLGERRVSTCVRLCEHGHLSRGGDITCLPHHHTIHHHTTVQFAELCCRPSCTFGSTETM